MARSKVEPVTPEEIIAALSGSRPQPLSANEIATVVWIARGQGSPEVASRHTTPVLAAMVADGVVYKAENRNAAKLIGRRATARNNLAYYDLAERANAILAEIEKGRHRQIRGSELAKMLGEYHPDLFTNTYFMGGEVRLGLTPEQAEELWDLLHPPFETSSQQAEATDEPR